MRFLKTIPIKTNYDERTFAVGANIQFTEDDKVFLVAGMNSLTEAPKKWRRYVVGNVKFLRNVGREKRMRLIL